jgi:hypothetical protein
MKLLLEAFAFMAMSLYFGWLAVLWKPEMCCGLELLLPAAIPILALVVICTADEIVARHAKRQTT